jgi:hypothetical protein
MDMEKNLIGKMVDRFLCWKLPKDFAPDCGISFDGRNDDEWNKNKTWPVGTNILTADQARQMFEHVTAEESDAQSAALPHQLRVIEERQALDEKRQKLTAFIGGELYRKLDSVEQSRLNRQLESMTLYSNILVERIAAFAELHNEFSCADRHERVLNPQGVEMSDQCNNPICVGLGARITALRANEKEWRDLERSYSQQLGEVARLSDTVCAWVLESSRTGCDIPAEIEAAANEIMEYGGGRQERLGHMPGRAVAYIIKRCSV